MKILFQCRPDVFINSGGDTTQCLKTKEYLEKLGVEVDISTELRPSLYGYDIIHLFGISRVQKTYIQCLNAVKQGKKIALSPIYWNKNEYEKKGKFVTLPYIIRQLVRYVVLPNDKIKSTISEVYDLILREETSEAIKLQRKIGIKRQQKEVLIRSDILLPNSYLEANLIKNQFNLLNPYVHIIPNCVDKNFANTTDELFVNKFGMKDFVLCCARIAENKNTLSLIKAVNEEKLPLVLIGDVYNDRYNALCHKEAKKGDVHFLGKMEHDSPLFASAYVAAKVHALVSWYETPGLVSLEAGIAGCNVVSTNRGSPKEYFTNLVWYCDPSNLKSIREAVSEAFNARKKDDLKKHILKNYTWGKAAEKTFEAYKVMLKE